MLFLLRASCWVWVAIILSGLGADVLAASDEQLLVSSRLNNQVLRYDGSTGAAAGRFDIGGDLHTPNGIVLGADGMIYLSSRDGGAVLRYRFDGTFDRVFASGSEMVGPSGLTFGPNGDLYVANSLANNVGRYDRQTGALVQTIGTSAELNAPISVAFGPDGDLYVTSALNNRLLCYDGVTGSLKGVLFQGGLLSNPTDIKLGDDGDLCIASVLQNRIARYDPISGTLTSYLQDSNLMGPVGLAFGPGGDLFVACFNGDKVVRVDHSSATISATFVAPGSGGLDGPQYLTFVPEPMAALSIAAIALLRTGRTRSAVGLRARANRSARLDMRRHAGASSRSGEACDR